jgi:halimadienyl-diphosphate synthase
MNSDDSRLEKASSGAAALLSEMSSDPAGQFSPSVYETGRLVSLAPSLLGHRQRVRFLLDHQSTDGTWGGPGNYALAPTLSATEALLTTLREGGGEHLPYESVSAAADRGLRALLGRLDNGAVALPDTVAIEIIVPALVADINEHLAWFGRAPSTGLDSSRGRRLRTPHGTNVELLDRLRESVSQGHALPSKLLHSLEVIGAPAQGAHSVETAQDGVGCSPAATATWLGDSAIRANHHQSVRYLEAAQAQNGAVPVATPLALFERAWVLASLAEAGLATTAEFGLVESIHAAFGEFGAAGGPGLPADADDTATALYALALVGRPRSPDCLWAFQVGEHFSCFTAERTASTSANAHVLQAFGACLAPGLPERSRYLEAITKLVAWLLDHQETDGAWRDKWHASPYYATKCCAVALVDYGGEAGAAAVSRAVWWVLETQRHDGSWGCWAGTCEETAYAMQILLRANETGADDDAIAGAAARGRAFLQAEENREHPPLWHDKDLYTPLRIVRAEVLAALHLAHTDGRVSALISRDEAL